jgi:glyoxylase-like metal-dependent hydrolase (beta-lactamase superfamily II)
MAETSEKQKRSGAAKGPGKMNVADHRAANRPVPDDDLFYPHGEAVPAGGSVIQVADGVLWARIPLPWSLDHINVYLFDEGDSWSLVDTGSLGKRGKAAWEALEAQVLDGKPIARVIATHMHPDHLGLAGWLAERHGASFAITQAEYLLASHLWLGGTRDVPDHELDFLFKAGVSRDFEDMIRSGRFDNYRRGVSELPATYTRLEDGSAVRLGGRNWRVVIGRGHSPEHACLACLDEPLFISGDQVLPNITSNVSVSGREPRGNPLAHWIASLERMKAVPGDPIVLPSHGRVFRGLHERLDILVSGHVNKLGALHEYCAEARTVVETFPALFRRKITGMDYYLALGEAMAHLHLLESLDLVERAFDGTVYRFTATGTFDAEVIVPDVAALPGIALRSLKDVY